MLFQSDNQKSSSSAVLLARVHILSAVYFLNAVCSRHTASNSRQGKASRFVGLSKKFNRWKALIKVSIHGPLPHAPGD